MRRSQSRGGLPSPSMLPCHAPPQHKPARHRLCPRTATSYAAHVTEARDVEHSCLRYGASTRPSKKRLSPRASGC